MEVLLLSTIDHVPQYFQIMHKANLRAAVVGDQTQGVSQLTLKVGQERAAVLLQNFHSPFHVGQEWNVDVETFLVLEERVADALQRSFHQTKLLIEGSRQRDKETIANINRRYVYDNSLVQTRKHKQLSLLCSFSFSLIKI